MTTELMSIETTIYFSLFSLSSLVLKSYLIFKTKLSTYLGRAFLLFCASLLVNNLFEYSAYLSSIFSIELSKTFAHFFTISNYIILITLTWFSLVIGGRKKIITITILTVIAMVFCMLHSTNLIVKGYSFNGYAWVAIQGKYYFASTLIKISLLTYSAYNFVIAMRNNHGEDQIRAKVAIIGFAPGMLLAFLILILMQLGFTALAPAVFSSITYIWLALTFALAGDHMILRKTAYILFAPKILRIIFLSLAKPMSMKRLKQEYEKVLVDLMLYVYQRDGEKVTNALSISDRTLRRHIVNYKLQQLKPK